MDASLFAIILSIGLEVLETDAPAVRIFSILLASLQPQSQGPHKLMKKHHTNTSLENPISLRVRQPTKNIGTCQIYYEACTNLKERLSHLTEPMNPEKTDSQDESPHKYEYYESLIGRNDLFSIQHNMR